MKISVSQYIVGIVLVVGVIGVLSLVLIGTDRNLSGYATASIDSDGDGVEDSVDLCPGYSDSDDWDGDGTPSGCETRILVGGSAKIYAFSTDPNTAITQNYIWSTNAKSSSTFSTGVTVSDGVVYGGADNLYALDVETGTQQWVFSEIGIITGQPTVADGVVYAGDRSKAVYAVTTSGTKVWKYTTGGYVYTQPAVADGIVYFGSSDKKLYAVDANTGSLLWSYDTGAAVYSDPAVVDGVVYVGGSNSMLYALDAATGSVLWSKRFADYGSYVSIAGALTSDPFVEDGILYISANKYAGSSTYTYSVYAVDKDDGTLIWSSDINTRGLDSPVKLDNTIIVTGDDAKIYALDASTGTQQWSLAATSNSEAVLVEGVIYIGLDNGQLYAIDPNTGTKEWYGYIGSGAYVRGTPAVSTD